MREQRARRRRSFIDLLSIIKNCATFVFAPFQLGMSRIHSAAAVPASGAEVSGSLANSANLAPTESYRT
jgi:hypothetical protein